MARVGSSHFRRANQGLAYCFSRRIAAAATPPEPAAPAAPAAPAEPAYMAELEQLNQLKAQGIISEEEYEAKKQQILGI